MNVILTYFVISTMCIFGTKLTMINSEFTEILPGRASADIVTKFNVDIRSNGKKKIKIQAIWVKNTQAKWKIIDGNNNAKESITDKNTYALIGEVRSKQSNVKSKTQVIDSKSNFEEDFVVVYTVGNSKNIKLLKIENIENIEQIRKQ